MHASCRLLASLSRSASSSTLAGAWWCCFLLLLLSGPCTNPAPRDCSVPSASPRGVCRGRDITRVEGEGVQRLVEQKLQKEAWWEINNRFCNREGETFLNVEGKGSSSEILLGLELPAWCLNSYSCSLYVGSSPTQ